VADSPEQKKRLSAGTRKGPPSVADYPELKERIGGMRADGMTLRAIAERLNADGVPTVRGGSKWRPSSVQAAAGYRRPPAGERRGSPRRTGGSKAARAEPRGSAGERVESS
jgi:Recombinase